MVVLRHALTCGAFVSNLMLGGTAAAQAPSGQTPAYPQAPVVADSSMRLQVKPRDTMVFVDGYFAGIVDDFDGAFQRLHVDAGQHSVQLFLPGHRLYTQDLYLQPGNSRPVCFQRPDDHDGLWHARDPRAAGGRYRVD
jgi:hypothetical protein